MKRSLCKIVFAAFLAAALGGCGIYARFETPRYEELEEAFAAADTVRTGEVHWRDFFRDEKLRPLIETALRNNADMQAAALNVEAAQASLRASKLAFLPSADFSPEASWVQNAGWDVRLPVNASWEIDIFGRLRNARRREQAALIASREYERAVRSQLIATVAAAYYTLLCLDAQCGIYEQTEKSWKQNVEVTRRLMNAGRYNAASLSQTEAGYYGVLNDLVDIRREIRAAENRLCALLGEPPRPIGRGRLGDWQVPEAVSEGVSLEVLSERPDVRQAEMELAQAFYAAGEARSAFYPSLTISGSYDFMSMLAGAVGSLFQPLFQRGSLKAALTAAEVRRQQAAAAFRQAVIDAGIEVNDAIAEVRSSRAKRLNHAEQVRHLENAVNSTQLLMRYGTATYLEVLTAQQTLLSARVGQAVNELAEISGAITLYQALGGGNF